MAEAKTQTKNLPALTPQGAIEAIKDKFPNEAAVLTAVVNNNVIALGTNEAFALRDAEGEIKAYRLSITLSDKDGYLIQPVPNGPFVVSAQGYEFWAEKVGACVIMPPDVLVDGVRQQNPYVIRDPHNRRILAIYCRAVAFRFSPMGLPMVSDWTTIFDNPSYRLIDLLAKAKKTPQAFKLLPSDFEPSEADTGTWAQYPFDESTNLFVNTQHEEALQWYAQIINREKKSIDFAQTFARRNALKHLSALQKSPTGPVWKLTVTAWKATSGNIVKWDATQYADIQNRVQGLTSGDRSEFKAIEHKSSGVERVGNEDIIDTDEDEDGAVDVGPGGNPEAIPLTDEEKRLIANLAETKKQFPEEYSAALQMIGVTEEDTTGPEQAAQIMKAVNQIIDSSAS